MERMTEAQARAFLAKGRRIAVFATVRPDGRPHAVPVWFTPDGDDYAFTTWHDTVKARNLVANGAVALVVQDERPPFDYVLVEGRADVLDDPAECYRIAFVLGARYMGSERAEEFARRNGVPGELVVRIHPVRVHGFIGVAS